MFNGRQSDRLYYTLLMIVDAIIIYAILCASLYVYYLCGAKYNMRVALKLIPVPFVAVLINIFAKLYGGSIFYPGIGINMIEKLKRLTISVFFSYMALFSYLAVTHTMVRFSRLALLAGMLLTMLLLPPIRSVFFSWFCRRIGIVRKRILIAGANKTGFAFAAELKTSPFWNIDVAGFLDDRSAGPKVLGRLEDYAQVAKKMRINYIAVCLRESEGRKWCREFLKVFQHVLLVPEHQDLPMLRTYQTSIGSFGALEISNRLHMKVYRYGKMITEIVLSCLILPMILPLCLVIALIIKLTSRGPVLYRARRLGLNGRPISVLKFRTMYQNADDILEQMLEENPRMKSEWEAKFKLKKDPRVTLFGNFLRRTSLDELPQFWNVIRGEMAIIGPRPIVAGEVHYYGDKFPIFSSVKPGITGLWQVSGRSSTSYASRVKLDVYYVQNWSIWMDYYIFLKTIQAVLLRRGAV